MKRSAITCGFLSSLVPMILAPGSASAQSVGEIYWGLFGGAQFYNDTDIENSRNELTFDPGYTVGGQIGYIFGSVRAEAEIEYNEADADSGSSDTLEVIRGTGGLYFDFIGFSQSNILPYVGGGFGFAGVELGSDSETALTAHGEAGVSFAAAENFDIVFAYRFEWYDADVGNADDAITANQIRAGIRFFTN